MIGWFLAPYKRRDPRPGAPGRYCAMDDFTALIDADGGAWVEKECLGDYAVVKVRASAATLQAIAAAAGFRRLPKDRLDDPLSDLTQAQRRTLRDWIEALGYPREEWQSRLGNDLGAVTLRQVLNFILTRRLMPRYDAAADLIVLDGAAVAPGSVSGLDAAVAEG